MTLLFILSIIDFILLMLFIYFESIDLLIFYILLLILVYIFEFEEANKDLTDEDLEEIYAEINKS